MENINSGQPDTFYSRLFAKLYDPFMESMEQKVLGKYRKKLLADLSGDILEVGSGTGVNFKLYPKGCNVIASEPSEHMLKYAQFRLDNEPVMAKVKLVVAGVGAKKLESEIPTEGLDVIVCTLVLCTIPDPELAIAKFKEWLKPDGKLIILEHVHAKTQPRRAVHSVINPLWKRLAEGCHLNRDTGELLSESGFEPIWEKQFTKVMPFHISMMRLKP
ncbi:MAG: ubiquinone/menaquinone biosynthesis C-methylase UbiE [Granulosicoccus sp.]|jgi:ubiquinone/menaquinone biosynthesis C-methylase UbiE